MIFSKKDTAVNDKLGAVSQDQPHLISIAIIAPNTPLIEGLKVYFHNHAIAKIIYSETNTMKGLNYWQQQDKALWPDVFILSTWEKNISSLETVIRLKCMKHQCKIIIVGDMEDDTNAGYYFYAGISGYVNLGVNNLSWNEAIETVCIKNKIYHRNLE